MTNTKRRRFPNLSLLATLGVLALVRMASDASGATPPAAPPGEPGGTPPATPPAGETPPAAPPEPKAEQVKFDKVQQAEIDRIVADAKRTAAEKATKEAAATAKQEADRAKLDEVERLKLENADKDKAAADATTKANQRVVRVETKAAALVAGVKADAIAEFMSVVDTSAIELDDDGEPNAKAIEKAIKVVLDKPTFKAAFMGTPDGKGGGSGGEHNGTGGKPKAASLQDAVTAHYAQG